MGLITNLLLLLTDIGDFFSFAVACSPLSRLRSSC